MPKMTKICTASGRCGKGRIRRGRREATSACGEGAAQAGPQTIQDCEKSGKKGQEKVTASRDAIGHPPRSRAPPGAGAKPPDAEPPAARAKSAAKPARKSAPKPSTKTSKAAAKKRRSRKRRAPKPRAPKPRAAKPRSSKPRSSKPRSSKPRVSKPRAPKSMESMRSAAEVAKSVIERLQGAAAFLAASVPGTAARDQTDSLRSQCGRQGTMPGNSRAIRTSGKRPPAAPRFDPAPKHRGPCAP